MRRDLPPFAALRAFEAAARYNSFALAAENIRLSASAISHQVRSLEEYLGFQLFIRDKGRVQLTIKGEVYYLSLQRLFNDLERSTKEITESGPRKKIAVNLFRSLLSSWLFDLVPDFNKRHPDIELDFIVSENPPDNDLYEFDVAIYYGTKPLSGYHCVHLFDDYLTLVCSPKVAAELPPADNIDDLANQTFLHCTCEENEWHMWYEAFDKVFLEPRYQLATNDRSLVLDAAATGMGVAIGRPPYLSRCLNEDKLTIPYHKLIYSGNKYYLIYPKSLARDKNIQLFQAWLLAQRDQLEDPPGMIAHKTR